MMTTVCPEEKLYNMKNIYNIIGSPYFSLEESLELIPLMHQTPQHHWSMWLAKDITVQYHEDAEFVLFSVNSEGACQYEGVSSSFHVQQLVLNYVLRTLS